MPVSRGPASARVDRRSIGRLKTEWRLKAVPLAADGWGMVRHGPRRGLRLSIRPGGVPPQPPFPARRAMVMAYAVLAMVALCGLASLAVDYGRVQLVKTELAATAEAAARAGAAQLVTSGQAALSAAVAVGSANTADGTPVALDASTDVEVGTWDAAARAFTAGTANPNAVRVTARRTAARGTAVTLTWAAVLGRKSSDVTASAVALLTTEPVPSSVTNKSNPWLAGMPPGTTANGYDSAPSASPTLLVGSGLTAGALLQFDSSGETSNQTGVEAKFPPDGNLGWVIHNYPGAENGLADLNAPISALIGVFLSDAQPDLSSPPTGLDFSTGASRNFATLSPQLKQPFFIGDGKQANGTVQSFVVPAGATRLYVGSMDGQQWSDNDGGFAVTVKQGVTIYRVETVQ
jgi:hypothetical protein